MKKNQEFHGSETSRPQVAALFKKVDWSNIERVLDFGGGKYNLVIEYMRDKVDEFATVDEFNRCKAWNEFHTARLVSPDVVTCCNVLNVIKEDDIVADVIHTVHTLVKAGGLCLFQVHEGNKHSVGTPTGGDKYQRNEPARAYTEKLKKEFKSVTRHGKFFECHD